MPTRMRLKRFGSKHNPHFRIVIADSRAPRDGKTIEEIGFYNPRSEPPLVKVDEDRAIHWLLTGAEPTETVRSLLRRAGILKKVAEIRRAQKQADEAKQGGA
ncbi:MAG: 30S ribosomal protein S16 [Armatimonadetes bacterium]|nr:30S ribosomal protein S16 [Armatimonadota bacterium]